MELHIAMACMSLCLVWHYVLFFTKNERVNLAKKKKIYIPNPVEKQPPSSSVLHMFEHAAICSDSQTCSTIGRQILMKNGSAVDASIGTLLCNGLLAMQSMGLGGGMLMNIYVQEERRAYSILSREAAPINIQQHMFRHFKNFTELQESHLSIGVPAELMGYAVAHEHFGRLPWSELMQPTIDICHSGFRLSVHQRDAVVTNMKMIKQDAHLRKMFFNATTQQLLPFGALIRPPKVLCRTLETLAAQGPRSFYNGSISAQLLADLRDIGSPIVAKDLNSLNVPLVDAIVTPLDNFNLYVAPPPSSGSILAFVMNILKKYQKKYQNNIDQAFDGTGIHRILEALKFGFAKRWELDMFSNVTFLRQLLCPEYAWKCANLINESVTYTNLQFYGANEHIYARQETGTAHISVLAPNGDAVSVTSTINFYFGSGRMGKRTGVLFNNAMGDFSYRHITNYFNLPYLPQRNMPIPQALPMSSMSPIIVTDSSDGNVRLVVGAAGGSKIISALTQVLMRILWSGDNIKMAIDAPRFHHQLLPQLFEYEYGLLQNDVDTLEAKGHKTLRYRERGSAICGVQRKGNKVLANADYRKEGGVDGF